MGKCFSSGIRHPSRETGSRWSPVKRMEGNSYGLKEIQARVPQGSVLDPILYLLYTCYPRTQGDSLVATFSDGTAILAVSDDNTESTTKLQKAITDIDCSTKEWRIKLNLSMLTSQIDDVNTSQFSSMM